MTTTTKEKPDVRDSELARLTERRERRRRRLDAASGGGKGEPGTGNDGNGGDGGGFDGGGAGGDAAHSAGTKGTRQSGGNGGGAGGLGGNTGVTFASGGETIKFDISGANGGNGRTGGSYGGGGGGGGAGVIAVGPLTVETATIKGGAGGAGSGGPFGSGGNGGGGAAMVINGPGPVRIFPSVNVEGGSDAISGASNQNADGGGGVGIYFDGSTGNDVTNIWTNEGEITGGSSEEGGGGAGVVLSGDMTFNNNGGTIRGGASNRASGHGILMLGYENNFYHTVAGGKIVGGSTSDGATITAPAIRVEGEENSVTTAGQILGGVNAIEFVGQAHSLTLWSGYAFLGNVVCQGDDNELSLGGSKNETFDLSSVGPIGSKALFQGFTYVTKIGTSTWSVSGSASGIDVCDIDQGELKLIGSGDLSQIKQLKIGSVLDVSGVTADTVTLGPLDVGGKLLTGDKALVLAGGGSFGGTITGTGGITIKSFEMVPLAVSGTISAGPVSVESPVIAEDATFADNVTIEPGGEIEFEYPGATVFKHDVSVGGELRVLDNGTGEIPPLARFEGNLHFADTSAELNCYVSQFKEALLEVSGSASLNNVKVNILNTDGGFGNIAPGTYYLIHAAGGINGSFTVGALPDSRSKLQVTADKKYLQLVVSP
jgi:hypothetical protein